jgi:hypothetical protein
MAQARFTAIVKKIDMSSDVKMQLLILQADDVLPDLLPMRATRVWISMETEQPDLEDVERINALRNDDEDEGPRQLTFDETGFNVPAVEVGVGAPEREQGMEAARPEAEPDPPYDGPTEFVCEFCGWKTPELEGSCKECGCSQFKEVPVEETPSETSLWITCPDCNGTGGETEDHCPTCDGRGKVRNPVEEPASSTSEEVSQ